MEVVIIMIIGIVVAFFSIGVILSRQNKKVRAEAEEFGARDAMDCFYVDGLGLSQLQQCRIWSFEDHIQIDAKNPSRSFTIPMDRIRAVVVKSEQEFKELDRSVIGRAFVGNLFVPGIGAIVGGMSGLKTKKKKRGKNYFLIINYDGKDGELKGVTFQENFNVIRLQEFSDGINELLSVNSSSQPIEL